MNAHLPQSYESMVELEEIAAIPHHIVTPRHAKPVIGVYQDTLVGSYRLTQPGVEFNKREFMNLMMWNKRFDGELPVPRGVSAGKEKWTGQQVLGSLLPPLNIEMGNKSYDADVDGPTSDNFVKIVQGDIKQGIVDSDVYMKPSKGIIHVAYNDCGPKDTVNLLDSLQNTIENFLVLNGFSVGISDLIADENTKKQIDKVIQERKKQIEQVILQVHLDLFDNNTGKTNQQEFEDQVFGILNQATSDAGKAGQNSLSQENRLVAMVRSGSKGDTLNIAQMMACLGQQAIEGKRVPYGFTDRTLPHYKKYDDSAEARGFIESSFIRGLTPQEFFFHAMSGREGLIDTAVKSVSGDTLIVVLEDGVTKTVAIGDWIDRHIARGKPQMLEERNMEYLELSEPAYIPTADGDGKMSWGLVAAVTRHDPGSVLYKVKTSGGKSVIVTESQSLLIWNEANSKFEPVLTPSVKVGDYVPVTAVLPDAPVQSSGIDIKKYLPKNKYIYGTDFLVASSMMNTAMQNRGKIPAGWWAVHNGSSFTLPYKKKALLQRAIVRSNTANIKQGYIYPFTTNRDHALIPEVFQFTVDNGIFIGLFLAEGNVDIDSGYIQITNNNTNIQNFVCNWFRQLGIVYTTGTKINKIGGTTSWVRGYSTVLASFLTALVGHGAENKVVPSEAFGAPEEFITSLLNGYFSGDGHVTSNSVEAGSASSRLIDGISMLCTRLGIFGKVSVTQIKENNIGTEDIAPTHRIAIRAQWATLFAEKVQLIDDAKQTKLTAIAASDKHRNFVAHNDVVLDEIVEITTVDVAEYPKMYDLTVPSTFNFGIANGLICRDTADTGYIQRQLIKALEDLTVQHDGTVRDANMNIVQFHYGEDGVMATKIETQSLPLAKLSHEDIRNQFGMKDIDWSNILKDGITREDDTELVEKYVSDILYDQRMLVEGVFQSRSLDSNSVFAPVNLQRYILNVKTRSNIKNTEKTDLTPAYVLNGINKIVAHTHSYHKIWISLLRFHLAPHKIIIKERFTKVAFDMLMELIVVNHMKAWVQPGEQVGIVAAQSIGEPSTQMTLNSVDWNTEIVIAKNGKLITPKIGEFIDNYYLNCTDTSRIKHLENNQIYIELNDGNDWQALSCDEDGKIMWTKLEAITRHPVINDDGTNTILEVELESGRKVKATKGESFLTLKDGKILGTKGSELAVGDELPLALDMGIEHLGYISTLELRDILSPTEWMYGTDVNTAIAEMTTSGNRQWFQHNQGVKFTVPYNRSDTFRDAFQHGRNSNMGNIRAGYVYPKRTHNEVTQIPESIVLDNDFGFFCGAYIAEGMSNRTQVNITNNDDEYLARVRNLMNKWEVGTHTVKTQKHAKKTGITGTTTSLIIHSTLLAKVMSDQFGRVSYEKKLPDWVLQASDDFVKGLIDGYFSGDGYVNNKVYDIHASSVSENLILNLGTLLARYGIVSRMTKRMPKLDKFNSVAMSYSLHIPRKYSQIFANLFTLTIGFKQDRLNALKNVEYDIRSDKVTMNQVVWDKIKTITEVAPHGDWVYDITVEKTRNFCCKNTLLQKDTFHQAGVASKSAVTRGVPRLRELLKVTVNPKATSLTIFLKPEYRKSTEKAREVVHDLELTLLRNITEKVGIYWDAHDNDSIIPEDRKLLEFYKMFEQGLMEDEGVDNEEAWSKLILRLELNREEMFNRNISIQDIVFVIKNQFNDINVVYSDYNSDKLVMRIRLPNTKDKDTVSQLDDFANLKKFQNKLLNSTVIRGLPGIKAVTFRKDDQSVELVDGKYEQVEQYILDTDGSNYIKIMNHPAVDGTRLYSTNVHDIYEVLGIEATRAVLYNEIAGLFEGVGVNYRHLCLLCDIITRFGRLMSIDRYGINKNDIGTLAKASFEETEKILLKAAIFGEVDPVTGVSANIMTGQPIRGGTAFSQIMLDEQMLVKLIERISDEEIEEEEEEGDITGLVSDGLQIADPCASTQFQMNMVMPPGKEIIEEDDVEIDIIDEDAE